MKKTVAVAPIVALILALSISLVYAQGRGAGFGRLGEPCPYGYTQPNPSAGGWWTRVQPTTPEQKAFLDKVADLHKQIHEKQFEAARLRATNGDRKKIEALENDAARLRGDLHETMYRNRELRQQMGPAGTGYGRGTCRWQSAGAGQSHGGYYRWQQGTGSGRMAGPIGPGSPQCWTR
jgi:hypothetical protein